MFLSLTGCKKTETRRWTVQYKAMNRDAETPTYRLTYFLQNGSTKVVGTFNTRHWESELLEGFEEGRPVQLEIEIVSGNGAYELQVHRNGALHEVATLSLGSKYSILESTI